MSVNREYGHDVLGVIKRRTEIYGDQSTALILRVRLQIATVALCEWRCEYRR